MSNLPPLDIVIPPKPNQDQQAPVTSPTDPTPPQKKSKAGKIVAWSCGGCLGIVLILFLIVVGMINNFNNALNQDVPLSAQDQANLPLAQAYNAAFTEQQKNLPHFVNWMGAQFNAGIPCASNVDSCLMGDTGSTADLEETVGPSKLQLSDAPGICDEVLAVAMTLGATQDMVSGEMSYQDMTTDAIKRCSSAMVSNARSIGFAYYSPSYFMIGSTAEGTPFAIQLNMTRASHTSGDISKGGEYIAYQLVTSSIFDSPEIQEDPTMIVKLNNGQSQALAFLDNLAYVRRANYDATKTNNPSPFSPETAAWASAEFAKYFKVDAKFEFFKGSDGMVRWFHVKAKDGFEACISTGTDKELTTQNEDAMASPLESGLSGLTQLGGEITGPNDNPKMGYYYLGKCHN
ncbi:MAG: hypothetical protein ORN27_11615 [Rhodoluna sp.]|nr:hypothetical protein [Rhodoluna sp.]